eukprot:scaffold81225_cov23-Tisochrysis_lutea.AAC.1
MVSDKDKYPKLIKLLGKEMDGRRILIFAETKRGCDDVSPLYLPQSKVWVRCRNFGLATPCRDQAHRSKAAIMASRAKCKLMRALGRVSMHIPTLGCTFVHIVLYSKRFGTLTEVCMCLCQSDGSTSQQKCVFASAEMTAAPPQQECALFSFAWKAASWAASA